ncbi:MAG: hypothetical protein WCA23_02630 [Stellaceae bacterium]
MPQTDRSAVTAQVYRWVKLAEAGYLLISQRIEIATSFRRYDTPLPRLYR